MDWKNFRQLKGQIVKRYTEEFGRRALISGVDLSFKTLYSNTLEVYIATLETLLSCLTLQF